MRPIDKELFLANQGGEDVLAQFLDFDRSGRPRYLYVGSRVARRTDDGEKTTKSKPKPRASDARANAAKRAAPAKRQVEVATRSDRKKRAKRR